MGRRRERTQSAGDGNGAVATGVRTSGPEAVGVSSDRLSLCHDQPSLVIPFRGPTGVAHDVAAPFGLVAFRWPSCAGFALVAHLVDLDARCVDSSYRRDLRSHRRRVHLPVHACDRRAPRRGARAGRAPPRHGTSHRPDRTSRLLRQMSDQEGHCSEDANEHSLMSCQRSFCRSICVHRVRSRTQRHSRHGDGRR